MFVYSFKGKSIKVAGVALLLCIAAVVSVVSLPDYNNLGTAYVSAVSDRPISFSGIKTEQDRLDFIASFGIAVNPEPIEEFKTTVPKVFDAVYNEYNAIQRAQGLDLSKFKGKKITRFTYEITNYPKDSAGVPTQVFLNLITYKDRVVAGDISSSECGGFVRTFCDFKPSETK